MGAVQNAYPFLVLIGYVHIPTVVAPMHLVAHRRIGSAYRSRLAVVIGNAPRNIGIVECQHLRSDQREGIIVNTITRFIRNFKPEPRRRLERLYGAPRRRNVACQPKRRIQYAGIHPGR